MPYWDQQAFYIRDLVDNGARVPELAIQYRCSEAHMRRVLNLLGIQIKPAKQGGHCTAREKTCGLEPESVRAYLSKRAVRYTDMEGWR